MNDPHKHNWVGSIETYSGIKFNIENPTPEMVNIEDIAQSLSKTCRYNGQIPSFYSVAEHSCRVADWLFVNGFRHLAFAGLMHDAAEAYIGDIVRPMKLIPEFAVIYNEFERLVETAIGERFNVDLYPINPIVKEADKAVYEWEVENIRTGKRLGLYAGEAYETFMAYFNNFQPPENFTRESQMENHKRVIDMTDDEINEMDAFERSTMKEIADLDAASAEEIEFLTPEEEAHLFSEMSDSPTEQAGWNPKMPESPRRALLMGAADLVDGDRNAQYGDPRQDFRRTAAYWNIHLNGIIERKIAESNGEGFSTEKLIDTHDVAIMMDLLKTSRLAWSPHKEDTWMDKAGYTACGWHCAMPEETPLMDTEQELSFWHNSHLGVAVCDACDAEWACHSSAWGNPKHTSTHHLCGGIVRWYPERPARKVSEAMQNADIVVSDSFVYDMFQKESNENHS